MTCAALAKSLVSFGETIPFVFAVSGLNGHVPRPLRENGPSGRDRGKKVA